MSHKTEEFKVVRGVPEEEMIMLSCGCKVGKTVYPEREIDIDDHSIYANSDFVYFPETECEKHKTTEGHYAIVVKAIMLFDEIAMLKKKVFDLEPKCQCPGDFVYSYTKPGYRCASCGLQSAVMEYK